MRVKNPPPKGAVFVQGESGRLYLMEPLINQRRGVHQKILQRMPEPSTNAGFISSSGEINQTSGVNQDIFGGREPPARNNPVGHICAQRIKCFYDEGNIKWI